MDSIRLTTDSNRITTVWFDQPAKSVNTISPATLDDLSQALDEIERDQPAGVIFASAKPRSFIAGADLFAIKDAGPENVEQFLKRGQTLFSRVAALAMPTVAAINGDCLGGGLELSLACRFRVAADDTSTRIGLPEVKLGIVPGWGGTVRLPRTIGLSRALPMMLAGKTLTPRKAHRARVVDDVVRPEALLDAARRWIVQPGQRQKLSFWDRAAVSASIVRNRIFEMAARQTADKTAGHYPAPLRLIDVVREGCEKGEQAGLDAERRALIELMGTDACKSLMRIFFLRQSAKRAATAGLTAKPQAMEYATVVGGGTMGAGIVHALVTSGLKVRLVEVNPQAVSAGLQRVRKMLDDDVRDGRLTELSARHAMNQVTPTAEWDGLGLTEFAIEAVLERLDIKREVFSKLDQLTTAHAVLASNTSSLRISAISQDVRDASRVVGMHFFNPVPKMPLVEIVRGAASDDQTIANAVALAGRLGKTPVVVKDAPGFLVNRVLIPYLAEAALLAHEGVPISTIDRAMKQWGWPMGPFELLDEIGLDVAAEVLKSLVVATPEYAQIPTWMSQMIDRGWLGKKSGRGFYVHGRRKDLTANAELRFIWPLQRETSSDVPEEQIQWRLMLPMINEAARVLEEGITASAETIDLATVMGLGFPPFRGGLAHYADSVGPEEILHRLTEMQSHGRRFEPASLWRHLVENHQALETYVSSPSPGVPGEGGREDDFELKTTHASKSPSP